MKSFLDFVNAKSHDLDLKISTLETKDLTVSILILSPRGHAFSGISVEVLNTLYIDFRLSPCYRRGVNLTSFIIVNCVLLIISGFFLWAWLREKKNALEALSQGCLFEGELRQWRERYDSLEMRQTKLQGELKESQRSIQDIQQLRTRLETENKHLKQAVEVERESLELAKKSLEDSFQSLAARALEGNNRQFLELAKSVLLKEGEVMKGDMKQREQAIESVMTPLRQALDRYQLQTQEIEKERQRSYTTVERELKHVMEANNRLTEETSALKNALKKPHVRGRWGEIQLKNCVELAGMSEYADVCFQSSSTVEEKTLRPDMIVRMPGERVVIVDAKTPIDAFLSALEANTDEEKTAEMLRHGEQVRSHVKKLSTKAYHDHYKETADFTVMFLPNESFLYAALEGQPGLMEYALEKKILIATPPTLVGLLKVIRFGWGEEKLARNAQLISEASQELHKRLVNFVETYEKVGLALDKAKKEFDIGRKRLDSRVLVQARKMEDLGAKSTKTLPENLGIDDSQG